MFLIYALGWLTFFISCALKLYGAYLAFQKKWWLGLIALIVPFFAEMLTLFKVFFNIDLLKRIK